MCVGVSVYVYGGKGAGLWPRDKTNLTNIDGAAIMQSADAAMAMVDG